jgi:cyanate lyase
VVDYALLAGTGSKGDRVKISMSGKFLPYKYYGAQQGIPAYGFKEE